MTQKTNKPPAVWFPTVKAHTGTDVFTQRLVKGLNDSGIKAEITWLPLRAEYAPWTVPVPKPPEWATMVHVNSWLHPRFIPESLPVVATLHHAIHHPGALSYKGWLRTLYHRHWIAPIERRVMSRANQVTAVSQLVAETAKQTLVDMPIQVIYNGVDTHVFKPGSRKRKPDEPFRLLYVGSWMARKGVDLLAPIMRELGGDFELFYTGGTDSEKDKANMPSNMHDIGRLNGDTEVAKAMQNADALLFPSRSEGFGLVAAEAMACGIPVIASRSSSLVEVVKNRVTGYLCTPNNVAEFSAATRWLSEKEIPARGLAFYINEKFSIQKNIQEHINIYSSLSKRQFCSHEKS